MTSRRNAGGSSDESVVYTAMKELEAIDRSLLTPPIGVARYDGNLIDALRDRRGAVRPGTARGRQSRVVAKEGG